MRKNNKGFTVMELIVVIMILIVLVSIIVPSAIRHTARFRAKAAAAVDATNLRNTLIDINRELIYDKGMNEITSNMASVECKLVPGAKLWVNYSKPVTLEVYFVKGDDFYSLDYMAEVAAAGESELSVKKPFTLGFWFELGVGKVNEYIPRN